MPPSNDSRDSEDSTAARPSSDPDDPVTPDDTPSDRIPSDSDDHPTEQPFCRVFGGPTSHRVQYAGPESRPATAIDPEYNDRLRTDGCREGFRTAGGRAIAAILERRLAALERAIEPVQAAFWRGETPEMADLQAVRIRLAELQIAVEEHAARACPDATPWEMAGEQIPKSRLVELLEGDDRPQRFDKTGDKK